MKAATRTGVSKNMSMKVALEQAALDALFPHGLKLAFPVEAGRHQAVMPPETVHQGDRGAAADGPQEKAFVQFSQVQFAVRLQAQSILQRLRNRDSAGAVDPDCHTSMNSHPDRCRNP